MKKHLTFIFLLITIVPFANAQKADSVLNKEIKLVADNDSFLFQIIDRYYSSGLFAQYRILRKPNQPDYALFGEKHFKKSILSVGINHQMYTPYDIGDTVLFRIDRPYAGWLYANVDIEYFYTRSVLKLGTDLGWLGPGTQTDHAQVWLHDVLNSRTPRGWDRFQVDDRLSVHLNMSYLRQIFKLENIDLTGEVHGKLGSVKTFATGGLKLRMGIIQPLHESVYADAKMGQKRIKWSDISKADRTQEIYLFAKMDWMCVAYDATLQGKMISGDASTWSAESLVRDYIGGMTRSGRYTDWTVSFNYVTNDAVSTQDHYYVTVGLNHRI